MSRWLNFTDRLVIMRRTDVDVMDTDQGVYAAAVPLGPVTLKRGWARASVEFQGVPHHFVTTHLEVQALAPVQAAQSAQLLGSVVAGLDGVTIIAGDLNSDAAAASGDVSWTPTYGDVLGAGFRDVWDAAPHSRRVAGFTCCQAPGLTEPYELDQRIDFVLMRSADEHGGRGGRGHARGHFRADVVLDGRGDRTPGGLWPSDHGGIWASVKPR